MPHHEVASQGKEGAWDCVAMGFFFGWQRGRRKEAGKVVEASKGLGGDVINPSWVRNRWCVLGMQLGGAMRVAGEKA